MNEALQCPPPVPAGHHSRGPEQQVGSATPGRGNEQGSRLNLTHTHTHKHTHARTRPHTRTHTYTENCLHTSHTHTLLPTQHLLLTIEQTTGPPQCAMEQALESGPAFFACVRGIKTFDNTLELHPPQGPCLQTPPNLPLAHGPHKPFRPGSPSISHCPGNCREC